MVVLWLELGTFSAMGLGSIPGLEVRALGLAKIKMKYINSFKEITLKKRNYPHHIVICTHQAICLKYVQLFVCQFCLNQLV